MKVLIDGAGLAGLVLAGFLKQGGVDVTIIEQAPHYKHMGYGIALWPLGKRVLGKLNLLEKLDEVGSPIYNTHMMDTKGKHIYKLDFSAIEKMYGKAVGIPRATLHSMVINRVGDLHTKFNTKVEKLKQHDNIVTVTFNNGNEENFDLVVGADGIRSQIRSEIFTDTDVDYYGISCWIAWAKAPPHVSADTGIFRIFLGNGSYMCFFPVGNNEFVTYLFTPAAKKYIHEDTEDRLKDIENSFKEFKSFVPEILEELKDPEKIMHTSIGKINLDKWYKNRVILIGDAEHAISPLSGMGTSIALEDAQVLAEELLSVTEKEIPLALERFTKRRKPRINQMRRLSNVLIFISSFKSPILCAVRNFAIRHFVPESFFVTQARQMHDYLI